MTQLKHGPMPGLACSADFVALLIDNITGSYSKFSTKAFEQTLAHWTSIGAFDIHFDDSQNVQSWPISEEFTILKIGTKPKVKLTNTCLKKP